MEKSIIIKGDSREVNKIIQENSIRVKMGLISLEDHKATEKDVAIPKNEKKEPAKDTKEL